MTKIEHFARTKQWWDTIDSLIKLIGNLGLRDKRINSLMLRWSTDNDFWLRRIAIEHQLLRKEQMNTELLNKILQNNLGSQEFFINKAQEFFSNKAQEFFINKAIGWALRDYSKTNPKWVKQFIKQNIDKMAKLSVTEGSKYL